MTDINDNKARIIPLGADGKEIGEPIFVQFNPSAYSSQWNITWNEVGQSLQWSHSAASDLVLTLNYDSYEKRKDVRELTKFLKERLDPGEPSSGQAVGCLFQWGKIVFKGVVASIKEDFSLFLQDGTPVRAVVRLTLKPWPRQAPRR